MVRLCLLTQHLTHHQVVHILIMGDALVLIQQMLSSHFKVNYSGTSELQDLIEVSIMGGVFIWRVHPVM